MRKKIQLLRNESVYVPSDGRTALDNAKSGLSNVTLNDGEVVIGRYQENNESVKTVLGIKHDIGNADNAQEQIDGMTFFTSHQDIKTINGISLVGTGDVTIIAVPAFTSADNGKILGVVNGQLAWVTPTTIYTGSGAPSSSKGNNGDIYLQTN